MEWRIQSLTTVATNKEKILAIQYIFETFDWEPSVDFGVDKKVWLNKNQSHHVMPSKELRQSHA